MGSDALTCPWEYNSRKSPCLRGSVHLLDFFQSAELYSDMKFNLPVILKHLALLNTGTLAFLVLAVLMKELKDKLQAAAAVHCLYSTSGAFCLPLML